MTGLSTSNSVSTFSKDIHSSWSDSFCFLTRKRNNFPIPITYTQKYLNTFRSDSEPVLKMSVFTSTCSFLRNLCKMSTGNQGCYLLCSAPLPSLPNLSCSSGRNSLKERRKVVQMADKQKPLVSATDGSVSVNLWNNKSKIEGQGSFQSINIQKRVPDFKNQRWRSSTFFKPSDIPSLRKALAKFEENYRQYEEGS